MSKLISFIAKNWMTIIILGLFIAIASFVFSPELQGKKLGAHDALSWQAGTKEYLDYTEKGESIKWTGRVFSGMPLYTMAGNYGGNHFLGYWNLLFSWLPQNVGILFIIMFCSFISLISLNLDRRAALIASIGFALNTWILDSLWASHPTKILGVAYIFCAVAGFISFMTLQKKWSLVLIMFGLSFAIAWGHYQIVYYGGITCFVLGIYFFYDFIINKKVSQFFKLIVPVLFVAALGLASNFSGIYANKDYSEETMRGGKTEIIKPEASSTSKTGGLDIDYAFSWSYTVPELFNFMIPDAMGGSSQYNIKRSNSKLAKAINQTALPMYYGEQPFTGAPNYLGVTMVFLLIFSMFYWNNKIKYALISIFFLSMLMGLGKHFMAFNQILFEYLPLYNKFRTPTMSFSILNTMTIIIVAGGLTQLFSKEMDKEDVKKKLKYAASTSLGLLVLGYFMVSNAGFTSAADENIFGGQKELMDLVMEDRRSFFTADLMRSLFFMVGVGVLIFVLSLNASAKKIIIPLLALLVFFDLSSVYKRYLSTDVFKRVKEQKTLIPDEAYNQYMINDKSHFRMINTTVSTFNDNTDGYRFNNVGGYSPAKLYRYQDLIDVHLSKMNMNVLNMLNTKYFVVGENNEKTVQNNPNACGNVWFVQEVKFAKDANEEMDSIGTSNPKSTAWVDQRYQKDLQYNANSDPNASIVLTKYHPENMEYESKTESGGFVVFSEIWYRGNDEWKLFVDGKEQPMVRTNYLLRGAHIPAGSHKVVMKYANTKLDTYVKLTVFISYFMGIFGLLLLFTSFVKIGFIEKLKSKFSLRQH